MASTSRHQNYLFSGRDGIPCTLVTNYYSMRFHNMAQEKIVGRYRVVISHRDREIKKRFICRKFFWETVRRNTDVFENPHGLVYDDQALLYSSVPLKNLLGQRLERGDEAIIELPYSENERRPILITIRIKRLANLLLKMPINKDILQFLNIFTTQRLRNPLLGYSDNWYCNSDRVYRLPFDRSYAPIQLDGCSELYRGLRCALKLDSNGLPIFNVDLANAGFARVNLSIMEFYAELNGVYLNQNDLSSLQNYSMDERQSQRLDSFLKGLELKCTYEASRYYKYAELVRDSPGNKDYFQRKYGIRLRFPYMPLVKVQPLSANIMIPLELLTISDKPQRIYTKFTPRQMELVAKASTLPPSERFQRIEGLVNDSNLLYNNRNLNEVNYFGVEFDPEMLEVEGRTLQKPEVYLNEISIKNCDNKFPNQNIYCQHPIIFSIICIGNLDIINIKPNIQNLAECCKKKGIRFFEEKEIYRISRYDFNNQDLVEFLNDLDAEIIRYCGNNVLPIYLFIMDTKKLAIEGIDYAYERIKLICDIKLGFISQVIQPKNITRMGNSMTALVNNLALKIQQKLGGITKILHMGNSRNENKTNFRWNKFTNFEEPTLFIGVDVISPMKGEELPTIIVLTSNTDCQAAKYRGWFILSSGTSADNDDLALLITNAINAFAFTNKRFPYHIVYIRGGLSDGQIARTSKFELGQIGNACRGFKDYVPTITYIVVQKRHSTRFFHENQRRTNTNKNIPEGTVVDQTITGGRLEDDDTNFVGDFYLCSQKGILGTSRPAHYTVVKDYWQNSADDIQACMLALSNLVGRSLAATSIPAPLHYADLLCTRVRKYLMVTMRTRGGGNFNEIFPHRHLEKNAFFT